MSTPQASKGLTIQMHGAGMGWWDFPQESTYIKASRPGPSDHLGHLATLHPSGHDGRRLQVSPGRRTVQTEAARRPANRSHPLARTKWAPDRRVARKKETLGFPGSVGRASWPGHWVDEHYRYKYNI